MSSLNGPIDPDDVPDELQRLRTNMKLTGKKGSGKVTPEECIEMRRAYANGERPADIRREFGYSHQVTIRHVTDACCTCHREYGD